MRCHKIHAYIRPGQLEQVEEALLELGVSGFSFGRIQGVGEYANYFSRDPHVEHVRLEVFIEEERLDEAVDCIVEAAQTHVKGDGLVAVLPVERVVRIRDYEVSGDATRRARGR